MTQMWFNHTNMKLFSQSTGILYNQLASTCGMTLCKWHILVTHMSTSQLQECSCCTNFLPTPNSPLASHLIDRQVCLVKVYVCCCNPRLPTTFALMWHSHTLGTDCHTGCAAGGTWQGVVYGNWWINVCICLCMSSLWRTHGVYMCV